MSYRVRTGDNGITIRRVTTTLTTPLKLFPYYGLYAPGSVYAPDRSRAKVLASLQRKGFASSATSVIGTIHPSYKPRGGIRFVITVTCPTCLFFARVLRPPLFTFALAGQLLTNVTFTY